MLRFRPADVTDPDAHALLDAYFAERSAGFPADQGRYRPTWPSAEQFTPPAGVFLVVENDDGQPVGHVGRYWPCSAGKPAERSAK